MSKKILGIIIARKGSKRIPNKNERMLGSKPLLYYTIKAAIESNVIDRLILSTDSQSLAKIAEEYGVEVPFIRPDYLATDESSGIDVVKHAVNYMEEKEGFHPEWIMMLQPTSPFRDKRHIRKAVERVGKEECDSVIGVVEVKYHPVRCRIINSSGYLEPYIKNSPIPLHIDRIQDLEKVYAANGAIFLCKTKVLFDTNSFYGEKCCPLIIDPISSIDLDEQLDWEIAEIIIAMKSILGRSDFYA